MANDGMHIPRELIEHLNRGDCVLFVGDALDGVSQSARLAAALVDACDAHCQFCEEGGKCLKPHNCIVPLTHAAQVYESHTSRSALVDFVIQHLGNAGPPGSVHHALAALPVRVIITTAYDDRLEAALREAGRPCLSVVRDIDVPFYDPEHVQVIRLHGTVSRPESLALTQDDMDDRLAPLSPVTRIIVQAHLASKTLLFVGYKPKDNYFRLLYHQVIASLDRFRRPAYAVQWPLDKRDAESWEEKITFFPVEPLSFLAELGRSTRVQIVKPTPVPLPPEPYKFLDYYTREDAAIFFGRDLEADLLLSTILAHKLTVFYGRSGTGKTSLLLARVAPALEEAGYRVACARMLGAPTAEVKAAVQGVAVNKLTQDDLDRRLVDVLVDMVSPSGQMVVVLDQFEEFFVRQGEEVRRAFARELVDCLGARAREAALDVRFVFSLRDDYLGSLDELSDVLAQDIFAHRYKIEALTREKALLAILEPAKAFGLPVEEVLYQQLLDDLEDQGVEPANLQIVLYRLYTDAVAQGLWSEADKQGAGLTLARYQVLGGTRAILAGYLDEVLEELPEGKQQGARAILKSMVTNERTKAALSGEEIARSALVARMGMDEGELDGLVAYLRKKRVLRKFGDEDRYELAHEVIVDKVWAWVSDEELRLLDIRDMLRREVRNYQKFDALLTQEQLELVTRYHEALMLEDSDLDLLFRSALAAGYEVSCWLERAGAGDVDVAAILKASLASEQPNTRADAASTLGDLGLVEAVPWLIEALDDEYPHVWAQARTALQRIDTHLARQALRDNPPSGMVYVPAGKSIMGDDRDRDEERPAHEVMVDAFYIARHPVTNAEYARFIECTGREPLARWPGGQVPPGKEHHPVVGVSWYEAREYCAWAGMRLLTEAEWEKAASWDERTGQKRRYPWGDEFDTSKCNTDESGIRDTTPVGQYSPAGDSPYGCADMAGNVWEWTSSLYRPYPYQADDGREDPASSDPTGLRFVQRGGSFTDRKGWARCTYRFRQYPESRRGSGGFRVGCSP